MMDLRAAARALGGEVVGRGILCPGPSHSARDRSLSVLFDASAPGGFTLHSHAGDDFGACRDHVRGRLGLGEKVTFQRQLPASKVVETSLPSKLARAVGVVSTTPSSSERAAVALRIWSEAGAPVGTPVEAYLARRGLALPADPEEVLRFAPNCPFAGQRVPAMVALVRNIVTDAPQAIHRTAINLDGHKVEVNGKDRLALGPLAGGAVKLTADAEVTTCLGVGEGIESVLSLQQLPEFGASPVWALLNTAGVTACPALSGIECLWLAVDHDPAGERAADTCTERWQAAEREVFRVKARAAGADLNDLREVRRA